MPGPGAHAGSQAGPGDLRQGQRQPATLTLTIPAPALTALALGNLDAARSNGLTTSGEESQLAALSCVLLPGLQHHRTLTSA